MKKLLSLLLVLVLAVGVFAACGPKVNENLEAAGEYLDALYKNESPNTTVDYDVVANVVYNGTTYPVTWSVNVEAGVTIVDSANAGFKTVKVERGDADLAYTLTATLTEGEDTVTKSYERVVPAKVPQAAIVDAAYQLEVGKAMDGVQTLTGKIITIDTPYDAGYKNVTVTIVIENLTDKPIMCYRLKGDNAADLKVGDTITVEGTIKNYNGTIEFDQGCAIKAYTAWVPDAAGKVDVEKNALTLNTNIVMNTILNLPATGATYTDVTITWTADGVAVSGAYTVNLGEEARTVTLVATLACEGATPVTKEFTLNVPKQPSYVISKVEAPVVGTAYKMALNQETIGKFLYFKGAVTNGFLDTTEVASEAVDVTIELVAGTTDQFRITFTSETVKKYVEIFKNSDSKIRFQIVDTPTMAYTWDATNKTYVAAIEGTNYYIGTYSNFATFSASSVSYITTAGNFTVGYYELVDRASTPAADKIANEKGKLTITTDITTAEVTVPVIGADYSDVTIAWSSSDAAVAVNGDKLNITLPAAAGFKKVTLTATIACEGATSETKEFTVILWKLPTTDAEIVSFLYSLERGMTAPGKYTFTGKISEIKAGNAYSSQFHNITVSVVVGNDTAHPVIIFRLKDAVNDAIISILKVGDTITVENGVLKDYNGDKEITDATVKTHTPWTPSEAEKVEFEKNALNVDTNIVVDKTIALPATGATYTDVVITWTAGGTAVSGDYAIALGDTAREITLVATITSGTATDTKTFTLAVAAKPDEGPALVTSPVIGQSYKLALSQTNLRKLLYVTGSMTGTYYLATSETMADAIDVTLEAVDGVENAFRLTINIAGAKKYIEMYKSNSYFNIRLVDTAPATYYELDAGTGAICCTLGTEKGFLGAYGTNTRAGGSNAATYLKAEDIHVTQFPLFFYESKTLASISGNDKVAAEKNLLNISYPENIVSVTDIDLVVNTIVFEDVTITWAAAGATIVDNKVTLTPGATEQTVTLTATIAATGATSITKTWMITVPAADNRVATPVTDFQADTAYKMMSSHNASGEIYFDGTKPGSSGANLSVTAVKDNACDVYLTATSTAGSYYIYILDGTTKLYLTVNSDNKYLFTAQTEAGVVPEGATLFVYDSGNDAWHIGTSTGRFMGTGVTNASADIRTYANSNISSSTYAHVQFVTFQ